MNAEMTATTQAPHLRDLWRQREAVRLHRRQMGAGDLHGVRGIGPALTCWQTGTVTSACLAAPSGACGPCGRLARS